MGDDANNPHGPPPVRRRLDQSWEDLLCKKGGGGGAADDDAITGRAAAPWEAGTTLGEELRCLSQWMGPRLVEVRCEGELVAAVERCVAETFGGGATVARIGAPSAARLAGDVVDLAVILGSTAEGAEDRLCAALVREPWVLACDGAATAHERSVAASLLSDDDDDVDVDVDRVGADAQPPPPPPSVVLVEHVNGAQALVGLYATALSARAVRSKAQRAAERTALLSTRRPSSALPRVLRTVLRCRDVERAAAGGATWASQAALCAGARDRRAADLPSTTSKASSARRGDEASLELCDSGHALYWNTARVLRPKEDALACDDDQEWLCVSAYCEQPAEVWPAAFRKRPKATEAAAAVADAKAKVLAAKRGEVQTCDVLRKRAKLGTYETGSYIDDDGKFLPLDRTLVDRAKALLARDPTATELPPPDSTEGEDDDKDHGALLLMKKAAHEYPHHQRGGAETTLTMDWPPRSQALVVNAVRQAPKKRGDVDGNAGNRGGALRKLIKESRAPEDESGPPPPRTADEQRRAAALDCARLELEMAVRDQKRAAEDQSLLGHAVPARALRELRARQLLAAALRANFHKGRHTDLADPVLIPTTSSATMIHGYAALAWRYATSPAACAFPGAFSRTEPLGGGGRGALHAAAFEEGKVVHLRHQEEEAQGAASSSSSSAAAAAAVVVPTEASAAAREAAEASARGDHSRAIAGYTAALGRAPGAHALFVRRSRSFGAIGFHFSALADARAAVLAAPAAPEVLLNLSMALGAAGCALSAEALAEYAELVALSSKEAMLAAAMEGAVDAQAASLVAPKAVVAESVEAAKARADAAFRRKEAVEAIAAYTDALRAAKASPAPIDGQKVAALHSNRAAAAAMLGAHGDALADGVAAAALAPGWVKGHVRVAVALRALRAPREAIAAYYGAMRIQPDDTDLSMALCDTVAELQAAAAA